MLAHTEKELRELLEALNKGVIAGLIPREAADTTRKLITDLMVMHKAMNAAEALSDGWREADGDPKEKALLAFCAGALSAILGNANGGNRFRPLSKKD